MRPKKEQAKKNVYPSEKNGLLTMATINGRFPKVRPTEDRVIRSDRLNEIADAISHKIQKALYAAIRKYTEQGLIITVDNTFKYSRNIVNYKCGLYLGKPSPNLSKSFKELVSMLDIDKLTDECEYHDDESED